MENKLKSDLTQNIKKNLFIFLILCLLGLGLIVTGFVLNIVLKQNFTPSVEGEKYSVGWYIYILEIVGAVIFLASFGYLYTYLQDRYNLKKMNIKQMSVIAVFGALSVILYYFGKFNLPFFPSWLDIQFSDIPALLVSFMYGPISGILVIIVRFFCKLPGTSTVGVGELADLLIVIGSSLTVYPASGMIEGFSEKKLVILNGSKTPYDYKADLVINEKLSDIFTKLK